LLKNVKKIIAGISAVVIMATATACGANTKWAVQYGDYEARAGIFLFYQMSAYSEAVTTLQEDDPDLDITDTKTLKTLTIDDTSVADWIQDKATENVEIYLEVLKEFDDLGLSLTDEDLASVDSMSDTYWQYYSEYYTQNGIGEQSFKDINTYSYKMKAVFDYYYAEGGVEEVDEQDLKDYYEENNARVKYICLNSTDSDGTFMSDEMESMAQDYLTRANAGEDFDSLIAEYDDYKTALAEEQAAEEEEEEALSAVTDIVLDVDTDTDSTDDDESTGTIEGETAEASNTEDEEDVSVDSSEEESVDEEDTDVEDVEESTDGEDTDDEEDENDGIELQDDESDEDSTSEDDDEDLTIGDSDGESEDVEDEEEDPYPNETIVTKSESEDSGTPTYKVNQAIFKQTDYGKAFLVEEDDAYYVVVRYDIWERDDLWTDDTKSSVLSSLKTDDFKEKMLSNIDDTQLVLNEKAYKRYDPLDLVF
jgi:hypothetical protein